MSAFAGLLAQDDAPTCWICLQESTAEHPLTQPCKCPTSVHRDCLARWCLHKSGQSEERFCRFCNEQLPAWQPTLLGPPEDAARPATLTAAVVFNNVVYKIPIKPGPEGKAEFKQKVAQLFGLSRQFEVTFDVKLAQDDKVSLRGLDSYEAATRCAARQASAATAVSSAPPVAAPAAAAY